MLTRSSRLIAMALVGYFCHVATAVAQMSLDPNGAPGTMSLSELKTHYGDRLKGDNHLCSLPASADARKPADWDCTVWWVDQPRYLLSPVDRLYYRSLPDGTIVKESYVVESSCERAVAAFFNFASSYGKQPTMQLHGQVALPGQMAGGEVEFERGFSSKRAKFDVRGRLRLTMSGSRCAAWHSLEKVG